MRLNPFSPGSIKVRRAGSGGRLSGGGGKKVGCGTLVIALVVGLLFGPEAMQGLVGGQDGSQTAPTRQGSDGETAAQICDDNQYAQETCNALGSLNQTWALIFRQQNQQFIEPTLAFPNSNQFNTSCGAASVGQGPFYCPADQGIYIDTRFYQQMDRQMGAGGDFARYYVIAHEYGHHIQAITGIADQIRSAQAQNPRAANQLQVRMELQADCYAGVWAAKNRNLIEPGDLQEGLRAASAIGDDTLQRNAGQRINPEGFTHGTSQQRRQALTLGLDGDDTRCDEITRIR